MKDPLTEWGGPFPYDVFADIGISPESPHTEVQDASFVLLRENRLTHEAQVAWDELRHLDRRLFVDLFIYPDGAEEGAADDDER
ncbi:hypothetical protein [Actinocrispum wychmicini]|uniref:Uncharacterized protein n=1 Tax=Actinocrispum wychmicini TaxID=1213861 RepID=A0A4R2JT81_9PSEU|nr:hypothetical protein [Actinocrispum wychmicini]TCO62172.1 hypothetical protein EV192_102309 [Actinocrispum wychmicini]